MPTLNMEIDDCGGHYKERNLRYLTRTNGRTPVIGDPKGALMRSVLVGVHRALKKILMGCSKSSLIYSSRGSTTVNPKDTIMKLTTIALATAFALSGTAAFANTVHHKAAARADRDAVGMVQLHPNYGNPNGDPDGPTTLSATGDPSFAGSSPPPPAYN